MSINASTTNPANLSYDAALAAVALRKTAADSLSSASSTASKSSHDSEEDVLEQRIAAARNAFSADSEDARRFTAQFTTPITCTLQGKVHKLVHATLPEGFPLEHQLMVLRAEVSIAKRVISQQIDPLEAPLLERRLSALQYDVDTLQAFINEKNAIITAATCALAELRSRTLVQPAAPASVPSPLVAAPTDLPSNPSRCARWTHSCVIL